MKKLGIATILLLSFFVPSVVLGQTDSPTNPRALLNQRVLESKEKRQELLEAVREAKAQREEERQERLTERKKYIIRQYGTRLTTRLNATIARLEKLIERINTRLDILETEGEEVDEIRSEVTIASALIDNAKETLGTVEDEWNDMLESDDPKAVFFAIKDTVGTIKKDLVEAHRLLVKVIGDIKGLRVGVEE